MNLQYEERTVGGLHDFFIKSVLPPYVRSGSRAVDLGAGTGALATRLRDLGLDVLAVDRNTDDFHAALPFVRLDLDDADFDDVPGEGEFSLVTAVEVIEHLERPIRLLRRVARLLSPEGVAVITTPNVDSLPARLKFLLTARIRMMDHLGDETHISPIFWDLLTRRYLPAGRSQPPSTRGAPAGWIQGDSSYLRIRVQAARSGGTWTSERWRQPCLGTHER
jgi:2-polyprenyl-3-methyl-5-hydroxy-6-metoxy-1,4-benzoquinol methylase